MKNARVWIGPRPNGETGLFVSPESVDASTATAEELLLHRTTASAQIAMQGVVAPAFPRFVPHVLGYAPLILPNLVSEKLIAGFSYVRPFDNTYPPYTNSKVMSDVDGFTFSQTGPALDINFFVFNKPMASL